MENKLLGNYFYVNCYFENCRAPPAQQLLTGFSGHNMLHEQGAKLLDTAGLRQTSTHFPACNAFLLLSALFIAALKPYISSIWPERQTPINLVAIVTFVT
jgi:hypothetical protein